MNGSGLVQDLQLRPVGDLLQEVARLFEEISFTHVFQELNQEDDRLSKEGQDLVAGGLFLGK